MSSLCVSEKLGESRVRLYFVPVLRMDLSSGGRFLQGRRRLFVVDWRRKSVSVGPTSELGGLRWFALARIISSAASEARGRSGE